MITGQEFIDKICEELTKDGVIHHHDGNIMAYIRKKNSEEMRLILNEAKPKPKPKDKD